MARSDLEFRLSRARRIAEARRSNRLTRSELAELIGFGENVVLSAEVGEPVRENVLITIGEALGIEIDLVPPPEVYVAADEFGGYMRSTHAHFEGTYYLYRRSFTQPGNIFKSVVRIVWVETNNRFDFVEYYEVDPSWPDGAKSHVGPVYMSTFTNLLHLMTVFQGSVRLATLTKLDGVSGVMRGSIQTQRSYSSKRDQHNFVFLPTISPIVLNKVESNSLENFPQDIAIIGETAADYAFASKELDVAEVQFVKVFFAKPRRQRSVAAST